MIRSAFARPSRNAARSSSSSSRARQTTEIGPVPLSARCSTSSRNVGSAQWTSSKTRTSGRSARARLAELAEEPGELGRGRRRLGVERGEDRVALGALVRLLEHLAKRPVRDALPVGEAAAPERRDALRAAGQLGGEPRLPDARRSDDDSDAHGRAVDRALERSAERGELALAPDEARVLALLECGRDRARARAGDTPEHRVALALDLERPERLERRDVVDQATRELADDDRVRVGRCLELRRDPDGLAGDEALPRIRRRRDDLAGLDPDADLESDLVLLTRAAR